MHMNALVSELVAIAHGAVTPGDSDEYVTEWVDMSRHNAALFLVTVGNVAANIGASLEQAVDPDVSPIVSKAISGKAISALTSSTDDKVKGIELRADELDKANNYRWARMVVTSIDSPAGVDALALHVIATQSRNAVAQATNVTQIDT